MTQKEIATLIQLLRKLRTAKLLPPHAPPEVWKELSNIAPWPAVEVLITRNGHDFLLTYRKDDHWDSWHIPGGFMGVGESIAEACKRVAKRELGITVKLKRVVTAQVWTDHPTITSPLSLLCVCTTTQVPQDDTFFTKIPKNTIPIQAKLLREFLKQPKVD